ncbi:MAG: hypothetical protein O3A36_01965 [bacterium]|nr:hypothetical protein [bacterium]
MPINLLEDVKRHKYTAVIFVVLCALTVAALAYGLAQRPLELISEIHSPGDTVIDVYSTRVVTQYVHPVANTISGIAFSLAKDAPLPPEDTPIIVRVATGQDKAQVHRIELPLKELMRHEGDVLYVPIPLITKTTDVTYAFSIQAPSLTKELPLPIAHEFDDTKYSGGDLFINSSIKAGALGFTLYERPNILTRIVRWMTAAQNKAIYIGILMAIVGAVLLFFSRHVRNIPTVKIENQVSKKEVGIVSVLVLLSVFILFQPALSLYFLQDDIPILLRAKNMQSWAELVFTNHPYTPEGGTQDYAIGFYRPITYSLFPWLTHQMFGLFAPVHHAIHLVVFAILSLYMYVLSRFFGPPLFAAMVTGFWISHSSKAAAVYWLSSIQDVLSSLFFIAALILYLRHRAGLSRKSIRYVWILFILALFSKDFSILLPGIILLSELYNRILLPVGSWKMWFMQQAKIQAPLIIISSIYIIIRTIALGDPTLPEFQHQDHSYDIAINATAITQNIIAYTHWTAESFLWPQHSYLHSFMSSTRLLGPFYPGLILILLFIASLIIFWKKRTLRLTLLFGAMWWVSLLLPNLLMVNERNDRWLTLPLWGSALVVTTIIWQLIPPRLRIQHGISFIIVIVLFMYGFWVVRLPHTLGPYSTLSLDAKNAVSNYQHHHENNSEINKVFFINIPDEIRGTINRSLLLLFFKDVPANVKYVDTLPEPIVSSEAIITVR